MNCLQPKCWLLKDLPKSLSADARYFGDYNGDGKTDFVQLMGNSQTLQLYLGQSNNQIAMSQSGTNIPYADVLLDVSTAFL